MAPLSPSYKDSPTLVNGEHCIEAVKCLQSRYNRPRLIRQTHVKMIVDVPGLNGRELRCPVQQHLHALKSMGHDPPGPFITSMLELKVDLDTMVEWHRHVQSGIH